ncbi:MAG TPA: GPR1/FUN34/YaaH family transporter [Acidimicrobiales bacterium]|nr:GPR1/FUN34/YaaH family transporter [Acidimicrobiales bacterium]
MTTPPHTADGTNGAGTATWAGLATGTDEVAWLSRTRVTLTPIAAPSIMGLFGFMIATLMVGAWQAGWYGGPHTPLVLWPFALIAGGVFQLIAAIASFRARDGVAVAVHSAWGSFWIGWSVLQILVVTHTVAAIPVGASSGAFGFWFIGLTLVTGSAFLASAAQSGMVFLTLGTLSAGAALTAAGFWAGSLGLTEAGGWLFVISAMAAWLTATAMMLEGSFGRTIIPLGKWSRAANVPGRQITRPLQYPAGMPGVRVGQ